MNIFTLETNCDICGGDGVATPRNIAHQYRGATIRHKDPRICAEILKEKQSKQNKINNQNQQS